MRDFLTAVKERQLEALKLYDPLPFQQAFHSATNKEVIIVKANQVGGPAHVDTPVLTPAGWRKLGELRVGDQVIGGDGKPCNVTQVHPQGWLALFRLTFDDGASTNCAENHHWRCKLKKSEKYRGKYHKEESWGVYSLQEIRVHGGDDPVPRDRAIIPTAIVQFPLSEVPVDPYILGVLLGDGSISHDTASFTTEDVEIADRVESLLPAGMAMTRRHRQENGKASLYCINRGSVPRNPILAGLRELKLLGLKSESKFIPLSYLQNSVETRIALLQGLMDTDGYCAKNGVPFFYTCSPSLARDMVSLVRSLGGKASISWKETFITKKVKVKGNPLVVKSPDLPDASVKSRCLNMAVVQVSLPREVRVFGLDRKNDRRNKYQHKLTSGRILHSIRPAGNGECVCITVDSPDHTYITEDYIVTHNSLASFVEVARAATNQDPYNKYPKNGVAVCLGYGEGHIGRVIHRYLFRYGAFNIIQDLKTGEWRTFRPWAADKEVMGKFGDAGREEEIRPSPPLIPKRFIEGIAWEKRANHVFSLATLNTGWEIHAFNSQGEAEMAQGFQADLFLIDEDVATGGWYVEALGRTAYRKGKIRWNALPHNKTEDLVQMAQRAEDEEGNPNATTICLRATMFDNPYYPEESKEHNAKAWKAAGEDVYRARALGEFTIDSTRMYPTFSKEVHDAINRLTFIEQEHERNGRQMRAKVQKVLTESGGEPPMDWCRYMVYDPGFNVGAVTFYAVPPPHEFGNFKICYDMLYLTNCTASKWGDEVELKMRNKHFQDFIIDAHGARLRELGSGVLPRRQYEMELEKRGLVCEARGSRFTSGSDDVKGREMAVRTWLEIRSGENPLERGYPTLLINMDRCANLVKEILQFRKKMVKVAGKEVVSDEGNRKTAVHAVETLEYAAAHGLPYVAPPRRVAAFKTYADEIREGRKYREARRRARGQGMGDGNVNLGPRGGSEEEW